MKNRILTFIIGILTGAIITTAAFFIINKSIIKDDMENVFPRENGQMYQPNENMQEPPLKPEGDSILES